MEGKQNLENDELVKRLTDIEKKTDKIEMDLNDLKNLLNDLELKARGLK